MEEVVKLSILNNYLMETFYNYIILVKGASIKFLKVIFSNI